MEYLWIGFPILAMIVYDMQKTINTQQGNLMKANTYINRLKTVAKLKDCDLSDVYDDRED